MGLEPATSGVTGRVATTTLAMSVAEQVTVQSPVLGSGERGEWVSAGMGSEQSGEVAEERAALEAAGDGRGEGAFDEAFACGGAAAVGEFSVDDRAAECAFGGVVRRLDALDGDERPQCRPDLEQLVGEYAVEAGVLARASAALERCAQLRLDRLHFAGEAPAVAVFFEGLPDLEQAPGQRQAGLAEAPLLAEPFGVAAKVSDEVLPADLAALWVEVVVGPPAVGADDPAVATDQLVEPVAVAVFGDPEDRRLGGRRRPQRALLAPGAPAGLIDVDRR